MEEICLLKRMKLYLVMYLEKKVIKCLPHNLSPNKLQMDLLKKTV